MRGKLTCLLWYAASVKIDANIYGLGKVEYNQGQCKVRPVLHWSQTVVHPSWESGITAHS